MLKKALTAGATVVLAILASAGVADASEVNTSQIVPLPPIASPAEPDSTTVPDPDEDSDSTSDTESDSTSDTESDSTSDTESDSTSDTESDSTSDTESDSTSDTESDDEMVEPAPAPMEEEPAAGPLGMIESLVTSLFG
jgi:hypothetical protein